MTRAFIGRFLVAMSFRDPQCIRYFSTVDLVTLMPNLRSSPTIRGEPHVGFACHIVRMSSRTSLAIVGRPGVPCWLNCR